MGKPAARLTDMHVCPMVTGMVPHVGGPISAPGAPTVLIGGMPAAVLGDICICTGPPDSIVMGSTGVMIGGKPAARMGDLTAHGGYIVAGCPTVLIGEVSPGAPDLGTLGAVVAGAVNASFPSTAAVSGAMAGAAPAVPPALASAVVGAAASAPLQQASERSWFRVQVKDEDGNPVADVAYTLTLPDGAKRSGRTDHDGNVREGGLPSGQCTLTLDELDEDTWEIG